MTAPLNPQETTLLQMIEPLESSEVPRDGGYSLAFAREQIKARRLRMAPGVPDEGIMSPKEYARRRAEENAARRFRLMAEGIEQTLREEKVKLDKEAISAASAETSIEETIARLTEEAAREIIENSSRIPTKLIIVAVCATYNASRIDIMSARRAATIVRPRQVAMYLAKTFTALSYPQIGQCMGGRDHTTVLHGVRKIVALLERDENLRGRISECVRRLAVLVSRDETIAQRNVQR